MKQNAMFFGQQNQNVDVVTTLTRAAGAPASFTIQALDSGLGNISVDWGDGQINTYGNNNTNITHTYSDTASAKTITITSDVSLNRLEVSSGHLTSFIGGDNTALTNLDLANNQLTIIDLSGLTALTILSLYGNQLSAIDVSSLTALTYLNLSNNQLTAIDLSSLTALTRLYLSNNQLSTIDLSSLTALTHLDLNSNQLSTIDLSSLTALTHLDLNSNQLSTIDVSSLTALTHLDLNSNQLSTIDLSGLNALNYLDVYNNRLPVSVINSILQQMDGLTTAPTRVNLNNQTPPAAPTGAGLAAKNSLVAKGTDVRTDGVVTTLTRAAGAPASFTIQALDSGLGNISVDWGDGQINTYGNNNTNITHTYSDTESAKTITITSDVSLNRLTAHSGHLTSFIGGDNTALTYLDLNNNQLTTLDLSSLTALTILDLDSNQLSTFDPTGLNALTNLSLSNNQLTAIDLSSLTALTHLYLYNNRLPVSVINSILQQMDGLTTAPTVVYLNAQTPPATPTGAGLTAKNSLIAKSVNVRTD